MKTNEGEEDVPATLDFSCNAKLSTLTMLTRLEDAMTPSFLRAFNTHTPSILSFACDNDLDHDVTEMYH